MVSMAPSSQDVVTHKITDVFFARPRSRFFASSQRQTKDRSGRHVWPRLAPLRSVGRKSALARFAPPVGIGVSSLSSHDEQVAPAPPPKQCITLFGPAFDSYRSPLITFGAPGRNRTYIKALEELSSIH